MRASMELTLTALTKVLLMISVAAIGVSVGQHGCPVAKLESCTATLREAVDKSTAAFGYFSDKELSHICWSCNNLPRCLGQVSLDGCSHYQRGDLEAIQHSCAYMQYFCQEELKEYRTHRSCFNNSALQKEGIGCNESLALASAIAIAEHEHLLGITNDAQYNAQDRSNLKCQYISEYIDCMRDAVNVHCSTEAGDWVFKTYHHYFSPVMEHDCLPAGSKVGVAIIFGTAIGLFTIMLIVIFTSIVCHRKQQPATRISSDQFHAFSNLSKETTRSCKWSEMTTQTNKHRRKSESTYVSFSPQKTHHTPKHTWNQSAVESSPNETKRLLTSSVKDDQHMNGKNKSNPQDIELINLASKPEMD